MPVDADELYLKLIYRRFEVLLVATATFDQSFQVRLARCRVTAGLCVNGWWVPEIARAAGVTRSRAGHWNKRGKQLDLAGLSLPRPSRLEGSGPDASVVWLTVPHVASRFNVDQTTVRRWIKQGRLGASRSMETARRRWVIDADTVSNLGVEPATVTVEEVARRYSVTQRTVRDWVQRGWLEADRVGSRGVLRIPRTAVPTGPRRIGRTSWSSVG